MGSKIFILIMSLELKINLYEKDNIWRKISFKNFFSCGLFIIGTKLNLLKLMIFCLRIVIIILLKPHQFFVFL